MPIFNPYPRPFSRRFGRPTVGDPILTVKFNTNAVLKDILELKNFFQVGLQNAIAPVNEKVAIQVQEGMVKELEKKIAARGRPQGPRTGEWEHDQGALIETLKADGNRKVTANQMAVGLQSWMEKSPAKHYYRTIEAGMDAYTAYGVLFFNPGGKPTGPWSKGKSSLNQFGQLKSRKAPAGYPHLRMTQHNWRGAPLVHVKKFPGYHYTAGGHKVLDRTDWHALYRTALAHAGVPLAKK